MLSIGKPPPDPPCACDELIPPPLNSDERASPSPQLPDLTHNPSLDFSIRNYVFAARNKDISTNWPFLMRNLQLCLKHGVKDPLPPFQSLGDVRNQSFLSSLAKSSSSFKKEISRSNSTEERLKLNCTEDNTRLNDGLADNNFLSMKTNVYQLETEPFPTNRQLNNNLVAGKPGILLDTSVGKGVANAGPTVSCRTETAVRSAGKKGRLVVKLGGHLEGSCTEDIASTSAAVLETMASKVCPVCKIFSSSSNTTLNAHIDQCLSEEPTPKWSAGSKLIRRRTKPRKTRLMVDIYETARRCTLEDLDRRNGSNWATGMSLPSQDTVEKKRQRVSPVNPDGDVGSVYIDSNGTKLRILSRFNNSQPSSSTAGEALGPTKCFKGKRNKVLVSKKKNKKRKQNGQKHRDYLKLVPQRKDLRSRKAGLHGSQDRLVPIKPISKIPLEGDRTKRTKQDFHGQEKDHQEREDSEDTLLLVSRSQGPMQPSYNGTHKQWASSKTLGAFKKATDKDQHPPFGCTLHVAEDLLAQGGQSYSIDSLMSDGHDSDSSEDPRNNVSVGVPVIEGESPGKRLMSPLFYGRAGVEGSNLLPMKQRDGQSSDPFRSTEDCAFHGNSKMVIPPGKSSESCANSPTKAMRIFRMEKNVPSACSARRSKLDDARVGSTPERSKMCLVEEMNQKDKEHRPYPSPTAETTNGISLTGSFTGSFGQDTRDRELLYCDNDEGKNAESVSLSNDQLEKLDCLDSVVNKDRNYCHDDLGPFELHSKLGTDDSALNFRKYLNQGLPIENRRIHNRSSGEVYSGGLCHIDDPTFPGIIEEDVGDGTNGQGSDVNVDLDTQVQQEYEVEGILIPGPPGSFLPSPGALVSEEFQGNSSSTTSLVQSSREQHDLVDGDCSDSPISATTTISDSAPAGSETKCLGSAVFAGHTETLEEKALLDSSGGGGGTELSASKAALTPQPSTIGVSSEKRSIEKGPLVLKNDDHQPCCCQRKERSSQGIIPNYLESQLLRRRNLGSLTAIGLGKRQNRSPNTTSVHMEGRFEELPQSALQDIESDMARLSSVAVNSKVSTDNGAMVSDRGNSDSATPSVCNPVLRLMGKNLMVINKDEDASTPLGHSQPAGAWSNNPIAISSGGFQPAFGNKLKTAMEPPAAPPGMSMNCRGPGYTNGTFYFPNQQPPRSNVVVTNSRDSTPMKEIIIIDDGPEDEITNMPANTVRRGGVSCERRASVAPAVSFPVKTTAAYEPRLVGTFPFNYPSQDASFFAQVPVSRWAGSGPVGVQWCSSAEGPGAFQQSHLVPGQSMNIRTHPPLPSSSGLSSRISLG